MCLSVAERARIEAALRERFPDFPQVRARSGETRVLWFSNQRVLFLDQLAEWVRNRPDLATTAARAGEAAAVLAHLFTDPGTPPAFLADLTAAMAWSDDDPVLAVERGFVYALDTGPPGTPRHGRKEVRDAACVAFGGWIRCLLRDPLEELFEWLNPPAANDRYVSPRWDSTGWRPDFGDDLAAFLALWLEQGRCPCDALRNRFQARGTEEDPPPAPARCRYAGHRLSSWQAVVEEQDFQVPLHHFVRNALFGAVTSQSTGGRMQLGAFRYSMLLAAVCANEVPVRIVNVPRCEAAHGDTTPVPEIDPDSDVCPVCARTDAPGTLPYDEAGYTQRAVILGTRRERVAKPCERCGQMLFQTDGRSARGCGAGGHGTPGPSARFWCRVPLANIAVHQRRRPKPNY